MGSDGKNGLDFSDQWNLLSGIQMNYNLSLSKKKTFFFLEMPMYPKVGIFIIFIADSTELEVDGRKRISYS